MRKTISVIGMGYVGLPLALQAEAKGFSVIGLEKSPAKLKKLQQRIPIIDDEIANKRLKTTKITFTDDFSKITNADIVIVCVPTPVDKQKNPDLSFVKAAALESAKNMKEGSLLVVESTINPGVCDEVVIPLIEDETDHKVGKTIYVAHCPERINPGDPKWHVGNINRVLGADSETGLELAYDFYSKAIDAEIKKMGNLKEAEACKIVENSFRDVNIAFVNELAMSFEKLGIDVKNVIDGAATKPFAFMAHYPGIGVGGHCIPVDPYYLIEYARGKGFEHHFLKLARNINESMPSYSVDRLEQAFIEKTTENLEGKTVTVLGLSYKANVADDRESPAYSVIKNLKTKGAKVVVYDPYFPDKSDARSLDEALNSSDAAVLVTNHSEYLSISKKHLKTVQVFLDGRDQLSPQVFEATSIKYLSI
ncbi:MAG: nucleotide sugar dehydrogenase [bacterium]|nr:nucleotide sugar dehydrogenase [bacterium]